MLYGVLRLRVLKRVPWKAISGPVVPGVLYILNTRCLCRLNIHKQYPPLRFVYLRVRLTYVTAQHPYSVLQLKDGGCQMRLYFVLTFAILYKTLFFSHKTATFLEQLHLMSFQLHSEDNG